MKKIIKIILIILLNIFITTLILLITYKIINNKDYIYKVLDNTNYYHLVAEEKINSCKEYFINDNDICNKVIDENIVKEDIKILINKGSIDHTNNYRNYLESETLINNLNNDYVSSLFLVKEYNLLYSNLPSISNINVLIIINIIIILLILIYMFLYKELYFISMYLLSLNMILISMIIKIILHNLYYSNTYYTLFINTYISNIINVIFIMGIVVLIVTSILNYLFKNNHKFDNII